MQVWRQGASREIALAVGEIPCSRLASENAGEADDPPGPCAASPDAGRAPPDRPSGRLAGQQRQRAGGPRRHGPGDLVLSLNGQPVRDAAHLRGLLDKAGKQVALLIERGDVKIFVPVDLG